MRNPLLEEYYPCSGDKAFLTGLRRCSRLTRFLLPPPEGSFRSTVYPGHAALLAATRPLGGAILSTGCLLHSAVDSERFIYWLSCLLSTDEVERRQTG